VADSQINAEVRARTLRTSCAHVQCVCGVGEGGHDGSELYGSEPTTAHTAREPSTPGSAAPAHHGSGGGGGGWGLSRSSSRGGRDGGGGGSGDGDESGTPTTPMTPKAPGSARSSAYTADGYSADGLDSARSGSAAGPRNESKLGRRARGRLEHLTAAATGAKAKGGWVEQVLAARFYHARFLILEPWSLLEYADACPDFPRPPPSLSIPSSARLSKEEVAAEAALAQEAAAMVRSFYLS